MRREEFESLVAKVLDELPPDFADHLENVNVVVEPAPNRQELKEMDLPSGAALFGLYRGVPLTERESAPWSFQLPDEIVIYQRPIERQARTRREMREEIRKTVLHEIAHHFGIPDERLRELGY
ncbi:MAG: metallopeptidase family protein [Armatimonadetes bacterium]|nr:metallopeptidase family protein [Armatimonadota bacterium]